MWERGDRHEYHYEYSWVDGDILYHVVFLSDKYPNACVFAYILEEVSSEKLRKEGMSMKLIEVKDEPRFGKYAGKIYGVAATFYKINEKNEPPELIINIRDADRYMWF